MSTSRKARFISDEPRDEVHLRLFAFPHAGGSVTAFRGWPAALPATVSLHALSLPGRGAHFLEAPFSEWKELLPAVTDALLDESDGVPFVFFGHSFGSLLAYEVCCELRRRQEALPLCVVLSAHRAPAMAASYCQQESTHDLPQDQFLEAIRQWGLVPEEALQEAELLEVMLPALRADLKLDETYVWETARKPLPLSVVVYGGREDDTVSPDELRAWRNIIARDAPESAFEERWFDGGHFYTVSHRDDLLADISLRLSELLTAQPPSMLLTEPAVIAEHSCVDRMFRRQAEKTPHEIALVDGRQVWTYAELDDEATWFAHYLRQHGVEPGKVVGVYLPHGASYVLTLLSVFKAGGSVCLLEQNWTGPLLAEFVDACNVGFIVTDTAKQKNLAGIRLDGRQLFSLLPGGVAELRAQTGDIRLPECDEPLVSLDDVAFISMTSGSTGRPSAVLTTHRGCAFCFEARFALYPYRAGEREGCNVFFAWECLRPLLCGQIACIIPDQIIFDPPRLVRFIEEQQITRLVVTPSLLDSILNYPHLGDELKHRLQHMYGWFLMGEVVPARLADRAARCLPDHVKLINAYSSWEALDVSYGDLPARNSRSRYAPAGHVIPGAHVLVLDTQGRLVPRGAIGQVHVSSPGLAPGYLNDADKTAHRFQPAPQSVLRAAPRLASGAILYATGDQGRILADNQLEVRGRDDDTVKLRGFKVALPFVEQQLLEIEGVGAAVVIPKFNEDSRQPESLVAYIVGQSGAPTDALLDRVKQDAKRRLPSYALPKDFIGLERLPLREGESRKLDRRALPLPADRKLSQAAADRSAEPTRGNRLESVVTSVWNDVLNLEASDGTDNFFDLGGNSLLAADLVGRLTSQYGISLSVLDLYQHSTLQSLIDHCCSVSNGRERSSVKPARRPRRRPGQVSGKLAVVGMAGRFPGASNIEQFWENLKSGKDSLRTFSFDELTAKGLSAEVYRHPQWVPRGQVVDGIDTFDAAFWGISPREATLMDPQHRVFLEVVWQAMEHAGYPPQSHRGRVRTGVFAACGIDGYLVHHLEGGGLKTPLDPAKLFLTEIGNEKDYISTRVAYQLDLGGPAITVTSACSSALVAVAQAAQAVLVGQCDMAIAGASSLTFPNFGYCYLEGMVGSADGRVCPFDENASGTLFGDAIGAVVIKRLEDAIADRDHIWALLTGFDVTNDGKQKAGYSAPNAAAQRNCIVGAMEMAGLHAEQISYVECHATATHVGDAIELQGLTEAFRLMSGNGPLPPQGCALGSVKGNIGHANCAAGITGFIKTVLALKHQLVLPTVHYSKPNSKLGEFLDPTTSPFYINEGLNDWEVRDPARQLPRRAGVSSFGIGGTNAHVILEEWVDDDPPPVPAKDDGSQFSRRSHIVTLSAKTETALQRNIENMADFLEASGSQSDQATPLNQIAYTLHVGREAFAHRAAVVAGNSREAAAALRRQAAGTAHRTLPANRSGRSASVVMCFPGQGSHYPDMARQLYEHGEDGGYFKKQMDLVCDHFRPLLGFDLQAKMFSADATAFADPTVTQPAIFAVEYCLAALLIRYGIQPVALAGHSIGEYVAATVAGVLTLEDAVKLVAVRAEATAALNDTGTMLGVAMPESEIRKRIANHAELYLAADNGPAQVVVSGPVQAVAQLERSLSSDGIQSRRLAVTHPFHSGLMTPAAERLVKCAEAIDCGSPRIPMTSNLTGRWLTDEVETAAYWGKQMVGTVRWRENVDCILRWEPDAIVEVGPGNTLSSLISKCCAGGAEAAPPSGTMPLICPSMRHARENASNDVQVLSQLIAKLWTAGVAVDWQNYHHGDGLARERDLRRVPLPPYAFDRTSYWVNPQASIYVSPASAEERAVRQHSRSRAPLYRVEWELLDPEPTAEDNRAAGDLEIVELNADPLRLSADVISGLTSGPGLVVLLRFPAEQLSRPFDSTALGYDLDQCWRFIQFIQLLAEEHPSGRINLICPMSPHGALTAGASKCIAQEFPGLSLVRIFIDDQRAFSTGDLQHPDRLRAIVSRYPDETDLLLPDGLSPSCQIMASRLEPIRLSSAKSTDSTFRLSDDDEGVYLITGGTGALGRALIELLMQRHGVPAAKIVVLTRKSENTLSPDVRTLVIDCGDPQALRQHEGLREIRRVSGIFHLAGALDDGLLINQTRERLEKVVLPKATAITLLQMAQERDWDLRWLLAYSSTTSLLGYPGQSNYGAANALLDQLAIWDGSTPVTVINWGSWGEVGMAARGTKAYGAAVKRGERPLSTDEALTALEDLFAEKSVGNGAGGQFAVCDVDWLASPWRDQPIVSRLFDRTPAVERTEPATAAAGRTSRDEVSSSLESIFASHISRWDPRESLSSLGLDSLDMLQLVNDVAKTFGIKIALRDVMESGGSVSELIQDLAQKIGSVSNREAD